MSRHRETLAAILVELGKPLQLMTLAIPPLGRGQVLVDVAYSGVCRSQLLEVQGLRGDDPYLPHTLGHEGSGTVLEVGPGVEKVRRGDRVVLSWIQGRGTHVPSTTYTSSNGSVNSGALCTFMQQTVTCESRVTPIPETMPLREAALLGCAIPTGAGIIFNTTKVRSGASVAVFGVGGIGLSAVMAAAVVPAGLIIAIDVLDQKLDLARKLGATHLINAAVHDPVEAIRDITRGAGVDVAVEATGKAEAMEAAFQAVAIEGGTCVLAGNLPAGQHISLDPFALIRGKRLVGTWGGESQPDRDIRLYVELYLAGKLNLQSLITCEYPLDHINMALDKLERGGIGRTLIRMGSPT